MTGLHTSHVPVMTYPTFGGYAPRDPAPTDSYERHKSRVVFVLLAIFLGAFGGHNFYAGYVKKAVIQLCITILSCFAGSFVSWIWAIVEACVINQDDDGVAFV
jgi:TM2 domain-containing membrane protein YozV